MCGIMRMPNKKQIFFIKGNSLFLRGFCTHLQTNPMNLVKAQIPRVGLESYPINLFFVWRQLESAFFGALASVGALFIFKEVMNIPKN